MVVSWFLLVSRSCSSAAFKGRSRNVKDADGFRHTKTGWKLELQTGAFEDGCTGFHTRNLSDAAAQKNKQRRRLTSQQQGQNRMCRVALLLLTVDTARLKTTKNQKTTAPWLINGTPHKDTTTGDELVGAGLPFSCRLRSPCVSFVVECTTWAPLLFCPCNFSVSCQDYSKVYCHLFSASVCSRHPPAPSRLISFGNNDGKGTKSANGFEANGMFRAQWPILGISRQVLIIVCIRYCVFHEVMWPI